MSASAGEQRRAVVVRGYPVQDTLVNYILASDTLSSRKDTPCLGYLRQERLSVSLPSSASLASHAHSYLGTEDNIHLRYPIRRRRRGGYTVGGEGEEKDEGEEGEE